MIVIVFFVYQKKNDLVKNNKITNCEELNYFLNNISQKDKNNLELLFRYFFSEDFAYSLFGEKPMSLSGYYTFKFYDSNKKKFYPFYQIALSFYNAYYPKNSKLKECWKTWKKYENFFSNSKFIFLEEPNSLNDATVNIVIINKKAFTDTINFYKDDFQKVLKTSIEPEMIFKNVLSGEQLFKNILKNHEALIGILLGYGRENSWNYYKKNLFSKKIKISEEDKNALQNINENFSIFAEKDNNEIYDVILRKMSEKDNESEFTQLFLIPQYMTLPNFMANSKDNETKLLEQKYKKTRKYIQQVYINKNFLEVTLNRFISD